MRLDSVNYPVPNLPPDHAGDGGLRPPLLRSSIFEFVARDGDTRFCPGACSCAWAGPISGLRWSDQIGPAIGDAHATGTGRTVISVVAVPYLAPRDHLENADLKVGATPLRSPGRS